jgi:acetyl-CoA carboxylase carboxyl transferase subunit alpha
MGLIDLIIPEPLGAAHRDPQATALSVRTAVLQQLDELCPMEPEALREQRYQRFRQIGVYQIAR